MSTTPAPKVVRVIDVSASFPWGGTIDHPKSKVIVHKMANGQRVELVLFNANTQKRDPSGRYDRVVFHWTAGSKKGIWDDYQICFVKDTDGELYAIQCVPRGGKGQHLHRRNTGAFGMSFAASGPADVDDDEIELAAKTAAEFCHKHGLDPAGKTKDGFWIIDDHAGYAKIDYPGHRWDVGGQLPATDKRNLLVKIRKKALWYHSKIQVDPKTKKGIYEFDAIIAG